MEFETGSCCVAQTGLKPVILLPQFPQSQDHKNRLSSPISHKLLWFYDAQSTHSLLAVCADGPEKEGRQKSEEGKNPLVQPITLSPSLTFTEHDIITSLLFCSCQSHVIGLFAQSQARWLRLWATTPISRMHEQVSVGSGFKGLCDFKFFLNEHVDSLGIPLAV